MDIRLQTIANLIERVIKTVGLEAPYTRQNIIQYSWLDLFRFKFDVHDDLKKKTTTFSHIQSETPCSHFCFKMEQKKSVNFPLRCELHGIVSCCIGRSRVEAWIMTYLARPGRDDGE